MMENAEDSQEIVSVHHDPDFPSREETLSRQTDTRRRRLPAIFHPPKPGLDDSGSERDESRQSSQSVREPGQRSSRADKAFDLGQIFTFGHGDPAGGAEELA